MKERPIIMSGPMVRAIIEGRKTQTRQLIRGVAPDHHSPHQIMPDADDPCHQLMFGGKSGSVPPTIVPVSYHVGDKPWVKETWQTTTTPEDRDVAKLVFSADWNAKRPEFAEDEWSWRSSAIMPRWASRITLEITEVRVQRLQEISDEDAIAEGVVSGFIPADDYGPARVGYVFDRDDGKCILYPTAIRAFEVAWDSINAKRAPWDSNPWVWAISFQRIDGGKP